MPALGSPIALCGRCRRETLPQLAKPSWHREKHRATADEREPQESPDARKVRLRKEARSLRKQVRAEGIIATAKTFLLRQSEKQALRQQAPDENCPDCLALQHDAA
jgi:hypothetical protein